MAATKLAKMYQAFGEEMSWGDWMRDPRVTAKPRTVRTRLASGKSFEEAISTEVVKPSLYEAFGEQKTVKDWLVDPRCMEPDLLWGRIQRGWSFQEALETGRVIQKFEAFGESKTLKEWANDPRCQVCYSVLCDRIKDGVDILEAISIQQDRPARKYSTKDKVLPIREWVKQPECKVKNIRTLYSRLEESKASVEEAIATPVNQSVSFKEKALADWLEESGLVVVRNNRTLIAPKELDIYLPEHNVAIEFNGLYWHSEKFKDKNYHYDKYLACKNKGIRLIQIWEDDWDHKESVVKNMILHKLGLSSSERVFARKTEIDTSPSKQEVICLLNNHHIQGSVPVSHSYGLRREGVLVAVLCMKRVSGESVEWDLVRYATAANVVGGFSRLLKAFRKDNAGSIKTFADLTISDGGLYEQSGFILSEVLEPDYSYISLGYDHRQHKFNYRKERFKARDDLIFRDGLTERELAELNGLLRVYDAGKFKYVLN